MAKLSSHIRAPEPNIPAKIEPSKSVSQTVDSAFEELAGVGLENVTARDIIIPRITILQGLSPQLDRSQPEFIPGASLGDICDVAMGTIYKQPFHFLPVYYRRDYLEWLPRSSGKRGLVKIWGDESILKQCHRGQGKDEWKYFHGDNTVSETAQFYGFNLDAEGVASPCFIPMTSTNLKHAKKWINLSTGEKVQRSDGSFFTPPIFYRSYALSSVAASNSEGKWYAWSVVRDLKMSELPAAKFGSVKDFIEQAKKFREAIIAGEMRADLSATDSDTSNASPENM